MMKKLLLLVTATIVFSLPANACPGGFIARYSGWVTSSGAQVQIPAVSGCSIYITDLRGSLIAQNSTTSATFILVVSPGTTCTASSSSYVTLLSVFSGLQQHDAFQLPTKMLAPIGSIGGSACAGFTQATVGFQSSVTVEVQYL